MQEAENWGVVPCSDVKRDMRGAMWDLGDKITGSGRRMHREFRREGFAEQRSRCARERTTGLTRGRGTFTRQSRSWRTLRHNGCSSAGHSAAGNQLLGTLWRGLACTYSY